MNAYCMIMIYSSHQKILGVRGMTGQDRGQDRGHDRTRQDREQRTDVSGQRTGHSGQRTEDREQGQGIADRKQRKWNREGQRTNDRTEDRTEPWQIIKKIPNKQ